MSVWYVFSAIGFYPVCPSDNYHVIVTPGAEQATIHLENRNVFRMKAIDYSAESKYVQSMTPRSTDILVHKNHIGVGDIIMGKKFHDRLFTDREVQKSISRSVRH